MVIACVSSCAASSVSWWGDGKLPNEAGLMQALGSEHVFLWGTVPNTFRHASCLVLLITPSCTYFYYHYSIHEKNFHLKSYAMWWSVNGRAWNGTQVVWSQKPLSCSLGLSAFTRLSVMILGSFPTEGFSASSPNLEDLSESSACFGRVNRAKCLSEVDASECRSLSSPWRAGCG